ncbi:MAG: M23 family metallopeptidase [Pseudomonadota bacterium]
MSIGIARSKGRPRAPLSVSALLLAVCAAPLSAQDGLRLALPIDCTLGDDCYIQQYVDRAPGPDRQDFACGSLANDDHKGTDFAVPTEREMLAGTRVLASAPGRVRGTRDGEPDIRQGTEGAPNVDGRECGNGVAIDHGDGWETQYCHLMRGSLRVSEGDQVEAGDLLGLVGMSGAASFPHVHLSVRKDGATVDPFRPGPGCGAAEAPLWIDPPAYVSGTLLSAGLADRVPDYDAIKAGLPEDTLPRGAPAGAMVAWAFLANGQAGDTVGFEIVAPDGTVFGRHAEPLEKAQPFLFRAWGRRAPAEGLQRGGWTATLTLNRDGVEIDRTEVAAQAN